MLLDPKWNTERQTLGAFVAWLETKPAAEAYDWCNPERCAVTQYAGFPRNLDVRFEVTLERLSVAGRWNFGSLLKRARRALEREHVGAS